MKKFKKFKYHKQHHSWIDEDTGKESSKVEDRLEMLRTKLDEIIEELNKVN